MKTATFRPERLFRALADKTRLRILGLLLPGELCVCDIVSILGCPQPTASRHLAYLRKVGLVNARKEGVWCYYRLAPATSEFEIAVRKSIECCGDALKVAKQIERMKADRSACCE